MSDDKEAPVGEQQNERTQSQPKERSPLDPAGVPDGVAGTGGDNKVQDDLSR